MRAGPHRRHPIMVLCTVVALPALMLSALWWVSEQRAARGAPPAVTDTPAHTVGATTPIWSPRRLPTTLAVSTALGSFRFQLGAVTATLSPTSCVAVGAHDRLVTMVRGDEALIPASTMKLLVAAVAWEVLGPDVTYVTEVRGEVTDGVVTGPLHLVGGGDPLLAVAGYPPTQRLAPEPRTPVERLIEQLVELGVTGVPDGIVVHDDRYDIERFVPTWGDGIRGTEAGPVGALVINDGFVSGNPVKGGNPAVSAGVELANLLRTAGVEVGGPVRWAAEVPDLVRPDDVVAQVSSAPLSEVIAEMLVTSDNTTAEMMLKEIAVASGRPGTRLDGLVVIEDQLRRWGLPLEGTTFVDGSGLDRNNRLTCALVWALLQRDLGGIRWTADMAIAGESGTMSRLLTETPLAGRLRAKTGTLRGVKAYSGYLPDAGGIDLTFTMILNGDDTTNCGTTACAPLEALARALATYPGGTPTPQVLAPSEPSGAG